MQNAAVAAWEVSHFGVSAQEIPFRGLVCALGSPVVREGQKIIQKWGQDSN